ncbi:hypothetical protein V1525DRAFT_414420 [Lipomyces kononenkoae]|uniref:Uncharacterized protein n=1 Tax=Lipomyces kononenkoae TaxID=34357 RepID=A0ACC3SSE2_LIPKO
MVEHLRKRHSIEAQERLEPAKEPKSSVLAYLGDRKKLSPQKLLQKNILRWILATKQPFTTIGFSGLGSIFRGLYFRLCPVAFLITFPHSVPT